MALPSFLTVQVTGELAEFLQEASVGVKLCSLMVQVTESSPSVQVMLPLGAVKADISTALAGAGAVIFCVGVGEGVGEAEGDGFFEGVSVLGTSLCAAVGAGSSVAESSPPPWFDRTNHTTTATTATMATAPRIHSHRVGRGPASSSAGSPTPNTPSGADWTTGAYSGWTGCWYWVCWTVCVCWAYSGRTGCWYWVC